MKPWYYLEHSIPVLCYVNYYGVTIDYLNQIPYDYTVEERNRFKGLDLIECLMNYGWTFMTFYSRQASYHPQEKERYTHLNAELQKIARRDKKAFFSDQCKEIEENNRMGKTKDLFKKIRDTKGTFHAKKIGRAHV